MARNKWIRKRHSLAFAVLRGVLRPYSRAKFNFKAEEYSVDGPCLILCNHVSDWDSIFVSLSFNRPVYFCATDDMFNRRVFSSLLKYLVAPIPKSKSQIDTQAIRDCVRVLKEGGAVGVFPEGNRTLSGKQWEMTEAVSKFVKLCKAPLVLYNIEGAYGADPRWGTSARKGAVRGFVRRVIEPQEYLAMSNEELFRLICDNLRVDDVASGIKFKSNKRAENIERVLYRCPNCGNISSITSEGNRFECVNCGQGWEYTEDLHIIPNDKFSVISDWYDWERSETERYARDFDGVIFEDDDVEFFESIRFKKKQKLAGNRITATSRGIAVIDNTSIRYFPFGEIDGLTILNRDKFDFYYQGKTYQVKGNSGFCSIKYVHLFDAVKSLKV